MIQLSLNNTLTEIAENTLLSDAIVAWGFADSKIAVAINGEFVPRSSYSEYRLQAHDEIDIVKPVGGG
ncbi:sulfur carrier protein ThiS [Cellvibrio sp. PSBB006]|jgi:sulfur carrier protein|uniref:sulfur carrier protein ThiS n=1 Tax=Cellvibrio sp. PSBB006 TaxID=1987723 RepID=UPI000B3B4D08|nr:sulfur carrier protein ThiS [Cellvibrio sp. PSBB006]ARU26934.1 thiamine biosynthesis protein ThiS [Cellvibrio sp. PSBB006]